MTYFSEGFNINSFTHVYHRCYNYWNMGWWNQSSHTAQTSTFDALYWASYLCSHEDTNLLVKKLELGLLWDEYDLVDDVVVCELLLFHSNLWLIYIALHWGLSVHQHPWDVVTWYSASANQGNITRSFGWMGQHVPTVWAWRASSKHHIVWYRSAVSNITNSPTITHSDLVLPLLHHFLDCKGSPRAEGSHNGWVMTQKLLWRYSIYPLIHLC